MAYQLVEKVIKIKVHSHLSSENERLRLHWEVYRNALFHLLLMAVEQSESCKSIFVEIGIEHIRESGVKPSVNPTQVAKRCMSANSADKLGISFYSGYHQNPNLMQNQQEAN